MPEYINFHQYLQMTWCLFSKVDSLCMYMNLNPAKANFLHNYPTLVDCSKIQVSRPLI